MLFGEISVLELLLADAFQGNYPILYPTKGLQFTTLEELTAYADKIIDQANEWDLDTCAT